MDELFVDDGEYAALADAVFKLGDVIEKQLSEYLRILDIVCDTAITEGATAQNLRAFKHEFWSTLGKPNDLAYMIKTSCENFISEIDSADEYLY